MVANESQEDSTTVKTMQGCNARLWMQTKSFGTSSEQTKAKY